MKALPVWKPGNAVRTVGACASRRLRFPGEGRRVERRQAQVGQEAYYEQEVAGGLDDYYAGRGQSPGVWAGRCADELGAAGVVHEGELGTLLRGVDPASGRRLRTPVWHRTITVERLYPETGKLGREEKRLAPVAGFDLVFSCPKGVSLLHALTDDEEVRRSVSEAHEAAERAALAYLEGEACVTRRGRGGNVRERASGFVCAAFRHQTSRARDPHLHTHVVVANLVTSPDGEWRALDGNCLLRTYRLAAGYLYEAELRSSSPAGLGIEWTEPVKGMAEIVGVPNQAMRAFSTRRRTLLEHLQARGAEGLGFRASRVAALATRERKEEVRSSACAASGAPAPRLARPTPIRRRTPRRDRLPRGSARPRSSPPRSTAARARRDASANHAGAF